ncbi:MAG: ribbon-helix-helix protein, CopG family [Wenzhouxiangella sp.]|nr:MAG: ribbon-helix-helix protein, CopG family [Wenzhouxiangella sp.]
MDNISIKISHELRQKLSSAARTTRLSQSEVVRRALTLYLDEQVQSRDFQSAADLAGDLAGCVKGGPVDLAENPEFLEDFGR